ncbi:hypothetical protein BU17DRAFT_67167 [Hysterangium stoloniferum]|nr:hypothetical protein BU17DRAFT_67167 [Hysterangium stoloniferum]
MASRDDRRRRERSWKGMMVEIGIGTGTGIERETEIETQERMTITVGETAGVVQEGRDETATGRETGMVNRRYDRGADDRRARDNTDDRRRDHRRHEPHDRDKRRHFAKSHSDKDSDRVDERRLKRPDIDKSRSDEREAATKAGSVSPSRPQLPKPNMDEGFQDMEPEPGEEPEYMEAEGGEEDMMAAMGFGGFGATKGKPVIGNQEGGVEIKNQRTWRQYMNRHGGFNRPLDKIK